MRRTSALRLGVVAVVALTSAGCFKRGVTPIRTHFNKGVYHYSHGDYDAAISEYRLALEEDAGDGRARFNLAEALEALATRWERARSPEQAARLRREAEGHYRRLLADEPDHLRASVNLAASELERGEHEAAEARLRAAVERHPQAALPRIAWAAHKLRQAEGSEDAGERAAMLGDAVGLLEEARRRDPANVDANMLLGNACVALAGTEPPEGGASDGEALLDRAREAYLRALEGDSSDVATLLALARLERRVGDSEQAKRWLRRALYVRADLLDAHLMLAEVLAQIGDLEGATAHLWRGRELEDPRWPRLSEAEYRRRLLSLYQRLIERERGGSPPL